MRRHISLGNTNFIHQVLPNCKLMCCWRNLCRLLQFCFMFLTNKTYATAISSIVIISAKHSASVDSRHTPSEWALRMQIATHTTIFVVVLYCWFTLSDSAKFVTVYTEIIGVLFNFNSLSSDVRIISSICLVKADFGGCRSRRWWLWSSCLVLTVLMVWSRYRFKHSQDIF